MDVWLSSVVVQREERYFLRNRPLSEVAYFHSLPLVKMKHSLNRKGIIRSNKDFRLIYDAGRSTASRLIAVFVYNRNGQSRRVGFVAGKKAGDSVLRNRAKRLLRECYRFSQDRMVDGSDIIFIARKGLATASWDAVTASYDEVCRRARLFAKEGDSL